VAHSPHGSRGQDRLSPTIDMNNSVSLTARMPNSMELLAGATQPLASPTRPQIEPLAAPLRLALGIATRGRPQVLMETLNDLRSQTLTPAAVLVAYSEPRDVGSAPQHFPDVKFLQSQPGLTRQRNTILQALPPADVLLFFDDDFCPLKDYLVCMQEAFAAHPEIVVATGQVVADGINGPGFSMADAREILGRFEGSPAAGRRSAAPLPVFNAYGCNMGVRVALIREHGLRFNEDLPLYGWYEDVEFSRQMARFGGIVKVPGAMGVHLGVRSGRQSGVRLGYSQVANPLYLARRRSVSWTYALASISSRSLKNLVRSVWPEPFVDRRGRLKGNLKALNDLVKGTIHPLRAARL
jgi:GT2 family glycosyltransferase